MERRPNGTFTVDKNDAVVGKEDEQGWALVVNPNSGKVLGQFNPEKSQFMRGTPVPTPVTPVQRSPTPVQRSLATTPKISATPVDRRGATPARSMRSAALAAGPQIQDPFRRIYDTSFVIAPPAPVMQRINGWVASQGWAPGMQSGMCVTLGYHPSLMLPAITTGPGFVAWPTRSAACITATELPEGFQELASLPANDLEEVLTGMWMAPPPPHLGLWTCKHVTGINVADFVAGKLDNGCDQFSVTMPYGDAYICFILSGRLYAVKTARFAHTTGLVVVKVDKEYRASAVTELKPRVYVGPGLYMTIDLSLCQQRRVEDEVLHKRISNFVFMKSDDVRRKRGLDIMLGDAIEVPAKMSRTL